MTYHDITVFGIANCDSVKKTRIWLENNNINYRFHDFRVDGLDRSLLDSLINALGYDELINRRSTSWRQLPAEQKNNLNGELAASLMLSIPTLIKRPVIRYRDQFTAGRQAQDIIKIHD